MNKLIPLMVVTLLTGCSIISDAVGFHKLSAGGETIGRVEGSKWIELTYSGKENESTKDIIDKWHSSAKNVCKHKHYKTKRPSLDETIWIFNKSAFFGDLYVYYPEQDSEKWPQVMGRLKC